jgi:hypothetical protein
MENGRWKIREMNAIGLQNTVFSIINFPFPHFPLPEGIENVNMEEPVPMRTGRKRMSKMPIMGEWTRNKRKTS